MFEREREREREREVSSFASDNSKRIRKEEEFVQCNIVNNAYNTNKKKKKKQTNKQNH